MSELAFHALLASLVPTDTGDGPIYAAPSAGAVHGCHVYAAVVNVEGAGQQLFHLDLTTGVVQELWEINIAAVVSVFEPQGWLASSGVIFFLTADLAAYESVYSQRGLRFSLLEVGFLADVIWRSLSELGLVGCLIGGFNDGRASDLLDLRGEERVAIAVACGNPAGDGTP